MGQININKGTHQTPYEGAKGIGFDASGNFGVIKEDGTFVIIDTGDENPQNIIANKGIGLDIDLPSTGLSIGDVYVTTDTNKIYTATDSVTWGSVDLVKGQFVTDVLNGVELPPVYQYYNNNLMPIANYTIDLPTLPTLPE